MKATTRNRLKIFVSLSSLAVLVGSGGVIGCTTRPLIIEPRIRPLDYAPEVKFQSLNMMTFVDETPEEEAGFLELEKRYRDAPVDVFNDALLASLRQSLFVPLLDVNEGTRAMGVSETDARVRTCDPLNQSPA